jgi:hypothetical protein
MGAWPIFCPCGIRSKTFFRRHEVPQWAGADMK